MVVAVEVDPKTRVLEAAESHRAEIDKYLAGGVTYPFLYTPVVPVELSEAFVNCVEFGSGYDTDIVHDLTPLAYIPQMVPGGRVIDDTVCRVTARGMRRIVNTIFAEFNCSQTVIDLYDVIQESVVIAGLFNQGKWWENANPIQTTSTLERGRWQVETEENILFRILLNAITNSGKARVISSRIKANDSISKKVQQAKMIRLECRQEGQRTVLEVTDDGPGFWNLYQHGRLNLDTSTMTIAELITQVEDQLDPKHKKHRGLGIIQHSASLLGAEVTACNVTNKGGAKISLKFPS